MSAPRVVGVLGAGTMGAGIAQLAAAAGSRALVHDPDGEALERGLARARKRLDDDAQLEAAPDLAGLAEADVVIEAAPESLELKRELFTRVAEVVGDDCVLATNTSSLSVTEIAAGVPGPERVVGMHFFNPAPVMKLVEVVAGEASGEPALERVRELGRAMGKHVIDASDGPGFLVNRCNRPFSLEALRLVQEGLATHEQVDRICRLGGGFRMGPFELMDLVGIDVGFEVSKSFYAQSFGEPRWRPSMLAGAQGGGGRPRPQDRARLVRVPRGPAGRPAGARARRRRTRGDRRVDAAGRRAPRGRRGRGLGRGRPGGRGRRGGARARGRLRRVGPSGRLRR